MAKSLTAASFVRSLVDVDRPYTYVYNDKTKFGRSIKVTGWKLPQYKTAKRVLENAGFTVTISAHKHTAMIFRPDYTQYRLHVKN